MTKDEALRMAIEAMRTCDLETETWSPIDIAIAIQACKEALEQPSWQGVTTNYDVYRAIGQELKEKNGKV